LAGSIRKLHRKIQLRLIAAVFTFRAAHLFAHRQSVTFPQKVLSVQGFGYVLNQLPNLFGVFFLTRGRRLAGIAAFYLLFK